MAAADEDEGHLMPRQPASKPSKSTPAPTTTPPEAQPAPLHYPEEEGHPMPWQPAQKPNCKGAT